MGLQFLTPAQRDAIRVREKRTYDDRGRSKITRDQVLEDLNKLRSALKPQYLSLVRV